MNRTEIADLKVKRARAWELGKAVLEESRAEAGWTGELEGRWASIDADVAALTKSIDRGEQLLQLDSRDKDVADERTERTGVSADEYDVVFREYLREGIAGLERDQKRVLQGRAAVATPEMRALAVGTGSAGGYTVPEGFWNKITEAQLAFGGVSTVANIITTATGNDLPWMTNDDTSNSGAILAEGVPIGEQDVSFGTKTLGAFLYTSKLVKVSYQLLQDSSIDIESFLGRKFGTRLARIHNAHQTTGTGSGQPQGIVTGATNGKTTAGATAITYNEIVDLVHSVDPAYRYTPGVGFMFSDGVFAYLRKVRDDGGGSGLGRPLWEPSVQVGQPNTLFGYPYSINQSMASTVATTNVTALFGDFNSGYVIRNVRGIQTVRLEERYAEYLQVGFFAFDRQDAIVDDASAYKALTQA